MKERKNTIEGTLTSTTTITTTATSTTTKTTTTITTTTSTSTNTANRKFNVFFFYSWRKFRQPQTNIKRTHALITFKHRCYHSQHSLQ
ncbi:hypothetical protein E2C01_079346 [Portunus trituberculatus]|uniref:Uncharacterized protein n=1 Tax=Portunus trituberculatus TaxID=210409 RepID=A0A5B7IQD3_PORTR|nr:hypothetical protein [Portunus trituberculatus]